jgi:hypothetical protein
MVLRSYSFFLFSTFIVNIFFFISAILSLNSFSLVCLALVVSTFGSTYPIFSSIFLPSSLSLPILSVNYLMESTNNRSSNSFFSNSYFYYNCLSLRHSLFYLNVFYCLSLFPFTSVSYLVFCCTISIICVFNLLTRSLM